MMKYKKQRGQSRKLKTFLKNINTFTPCWHDEYGYEHFHVPCSLDFINSPKTYGKIKISFKKNGLKPPQSI